MRVISELKIDKSEKIYQRRVKALQMREKKQLKRDLAAAGLLRYEESCRTESEFLRLAGMYDDLDALRERRERRHEVQAFDALENWMLGDGGVVPVPIGHPWWRQLMRGDFIDFIHDCPHEIHELTSSQNISEMLRALDENHKEIMYYRVIRQWSPQRLAAFRGQTDRNIRKVYSKMIADLREELYERLKGRYERGAPLTLEQRTFCANYKAALNGGEEGLLCD
jgi:hypothetical protein